MRTHLRSLLAASGLCLPALALLAPEPTGTVDSPTRPPVALDDQDDQDDHGDDHHGEEDVLHEAMETLNDGLRELRGLMRAGEVAPMLPVLDSIQAAVVAGKGQVPESVEAVPEEQHAAFALDFRSEQLALLEKLCRLERMLLDGQLAEAGEFLDGEVMAMKRPSHARFKQPGGWTPR